MTDIERLRELLALEDMLCAQEGGPTHEDCVRFDYECACFISAHGKSLLADYERLRGMEERVKGAVKALVIGATGSLNGQQIRVVAYVKEGPGHKAHDLVSQTVALVPVPGGE